MTCPRREKRKISSFPSVSRTSFSSSRGLRLMAARPVRGESYSVSFVFFTMPFFVAKKRYLPSSYFLRSMTALTFSSPVIETPGRFAT